MPPSSSDEVARRWRMMPPIPPDVLSSLSVYHPVMAQVLYNRGQDSPEKVRVFLQGGDGALHNPFLMMGMSDAVSRIRRAIKHGELIAVYGDFDADGVTSTALLTQALRALGARVRPYIPSRVDEGYGVNDDALDALAREGVKLMITVDCGIRAVDEIEYGKSLGLDIIVTDHHSVGEQLPGALAVLNPKVDAKRRRDEGRTDGYPEDMLAGVGVAYKLADALFRAARQQTRRNQDGLRLEDLLDLVAVGTVADLAPMDRLENRELVRRGLEVLNLAKRPGIYELLQVAGVEPGKIDTTTIGFVLGPRINAAGRLDNAMVAYQLLTEEITRAGELAQQLQELNTQRQVLTMEAVEIARDIALSEASEDLPLLFASDARFVPGIVGLVAGRLCEEFYRPAVVIERGEDESRGSCRSIPEFDITHALDQCADLLVRHGGHAQAAGFTICNENLPALRERLTALVAEGLADQELRPVLDIDAEVPFDYLTMALAETLRELEPTGANNDPPLLATRRLNVLEYKRVGKDGKHLRLRLSDGFGQIGGIAFRQGDWTDHMPSCVDVVHHLEINEWNGQVRLQLNVQDLRPAE
ncbi:MAG: single-stranded-DNA-specific exonuclease RecJ [Anaerolineae bacterium]|nr:single-stranded-DNA-specific exonuclease RecJ [Anaerolineae bacterium]